jgi:putative acetyltransferase
MEVRDATPSDAEAVRTVHRRSITELGTEGYGDAQVEAWARGCASAGYASAIEAEGSEFVVADDGGDVVAFGSLALSAPDEVDADGEVTGVYVLPSVAREGVGTRVYSKLERRARARGARTLGLSASLNAVPFYEAQGYERVGERTHEFSSHESTGVTGVVVEMRKEL